MSRRVLRIVLMVGGLGVLAGCGLFRFDVREPWRSEAEAKCMAEGHVRESAVIERRPAITGLGACGLDYPLRVSAFSHGHVGVGPEPATLSCPMVSRLDRWVDAALQPIAMAHFGAPVAEIEQNGSYSCRRMNHAYSGPLSEHAFANGLDIKAFRLVDGRRVSISQGWRGLPEERAFLRDVHASACEYFSTVLGPGSDGMHEDHLHIDLARRARGSICRPDARPSGLVAGQPFMTGSIGR